MVSGSPEALLAPFSDPAHVARYAEGPPRFVPGFADLHRMTSLLLSERAPLDGTVLVVGAGGGLELRAFAEAQPGWSFVGIDPAAEMLREAERTLGALRARVGLHHGYVDDAPEGPFDAATCLLTLHLLSPVERRRTAAEIRRRLKPGAPFVAAHLSFPQHDEERAVWLSRYAAFAVAAGAAPDQARKAQTAVSERLNLLSPEQDEAILCEAGFRSVSLFYAALCWRGWVAYA